MVSFGFTKIVVADVDKMFNFYKRVFGLRSVARVRVGEGADELDEIIMGLEGEDNAMPNLVIQRYPNRPLPLPGEATLGFIVPDVDRLVDDALAAGAALHKPARVEADHGVRVAFIKDIEGYLLEVVEML